MKFLRIPNCNLAVNPQMKLVANQAIEDELLPRSFGGLKIIVAIGDLHGNWWKFFCILVYLGLIDAPEDTKSNLLRLYSQIDQLKKGLVNAITSQASEEELSARDLDIGSAYLEFEQQVGFLTISPYYCKQIQIVLIGDIFADRGCSDYCMALLLEWAISREIDIVIIMSNHDALFIKMLENDFEQVPWQSEQEISSYASCLDLYLAPDNAFSRSRGKEIFQRILAPRYRMAICYYSYDFVKKAYCNVIMTHTPNNLGSIAVMLNSIGANSIDDINISYLMHLPSGQFYNHPVVNDFLGLNGHELRNPPITNKELSVFGHIGAEILLHGLILHPGQICLDSILGMPTGFCQGPLQQFQTRAINGELLLFIDTPALISEQTLTNLRCKEIKLTQIESLIYNEGYERSIINNMEAQGRRHIDQEFDLLDDEDCNRRMIEASEEQERSILLQQMRLTAPPPPSWMKNR